MGSLGGYVSPYGVYLDQQRVFLLVINRRPRDLFDYLHSIPGAPADLRCRLVGFAERALLAPRLGNWWPDESSWTLYWAMYAWAHADAMLNRLCAPQISGNPSNFDAALAFANLSLGQPGSQQMAPQELMQNNYGTPAMRVPSLHQPGPAQLTPQGLMQNREVLPTVDIKGKGPALGVGQQELRVHVACLMADDGTTGAAGLLIKRETWQFICALCFPMRSTEETVLFAAACCEGIKVALAYQPTSIVLESHLFHLVDLLLGGAQAPCRDMEELTALLQLSRCRVQHITEDSNGAARRLAMHCLLREEAEIYFSAPDWLVLT
ncbi:hypothetical protein VPH35_127990 [Triticum aestivum]